MSEIDEDAAGRLFLSYLGEDAYMARASESDSSIFDPNIGTIEHPAAWTGFQVILDATGSKIVQNFEETRGDSFLCLRGAFATDDQSAMTGNKAAALHLTTTSPVGRALEQAASQPRTGRGRSPPRVR